MLDIVCGYKLRSDIVLRSANEKFWALSTTTGNQYKLNEVAYSVLNELTEAKSIDELSDIITKIYKVSNQEFANDCKALIENAVDAGIVEEVKI